MYFRHLILCSAFLMGAIVMEAQNKSHTDSLIKILKGSKTFAPAEEQKLFEVVINDLVDLDSAQASYYLDEWKKKFYNSGSAQKLFYHKNRGILFLNAANYTAALAEVNKGIELSTKNKKQVELADFYNNRANLYADMEKDQEALHDYDASLAIYRQLRLTRDVALTLSNKANLYGAKGNFKDAIPFALEALKLREALNDKPGIANTSFNLAIMFKNMKRYEEALNFLLVPESYYQQTGNERSLATVHLVRGSTYRSLGEYAKSKSWFLKALPALEKYQFKGGLVNAYQNLGTLAAVADSNEEKALAFYQKAEKIVGELKNVQGTISTGINVAQSLLNLKKYEDFNRKINTIEPLARQHHYNQELREILKLKMNYLMELSGTSDGKVAFDDYERIGDSVNGKSIQQQISELNIRYETEKKVTQIELLNSQNRLQQQILSKNKLELLNNELAMQKKDLEIGNQGLEINNQNLLLKNKDVLLSNNHLELQNRQQQINILRLSDKNKSLQLQQKNRLLLSGIIIFLLLSGVVILYYYRLRSRQRERAQQLIIREQDQAAKAVISAEENERSRMSQHLHDGLGQLLSATKMNLQAAIEQLPPDQKAGKIYTNALQLVDESILEMRSVSHQMVTNNVIRKGLGNALKDLIEKIETNNLRVTLDVKGLLQHIDPEIQIVVYRILQECIHNVVKHAAASKIDISLVAELSTLKATVRDNGRGFWPEQAKHRSGIGLDNITTRVKFLKGRWTLESSPGQGTIVQVDIPLHQKSP